MIAMGVVRGRPLFRPRMVMSPLKPIGMRVPNSDLEIGVKIVTHHGAPAALPAALLIPSLIWVAPSWIDAFGCHQGDPQEGANVTAARRLEVSRPPP